jgi:hypothetical protein
LKILKRGAGDGRRRTHRVEMEEKEHCKKKKASCIVHILRGNCLPKHFIEGKIEGGIAVTGRRRRSRKQQLYVF